MKICEYGKVMTFFFEIALKSLGNYCRLKRKPIIFLCLKSDDLFWGEEKTFMIQIGKCAGASSGMQI